MAEAPSEDMAKRKTSTRTLRILRSLLMLGLIGFIILVGLLYRFGKSGMPSSTPTSSDSDTTAGAAVMAGQGFDYVLTQSNEPIGRIRADRLISEHEDEVVLEGINPIEIYREDGDIYRLFADTGTYNLETQGAVLRGNVRLEGPDGLELFTRGLNVNHRANRVTSERSVQFRMAGEFVGRARNLVANLKRDIFTLSGAVEINSTSPVRDAIRMSADRLSYARTEFIVRANGRVRFQRGESYLFAPAMQFYLTEDEKAVRFVAARDGVEALEQTRFGAQLVRQLEMKGAELAVVFDEASGKPVEAEIRGTAARPALLSSTDEAQVVRSMTAPVLQARFTDGELSYAEAFDKVYLREYLSFDPERILAWGCGDRAEVSFEPGGEIREGTFYERVEFRNPQASAQGDRIVMTGDPYEVHMVGEPARVVAVQGELTAPMIVQREEGGEIRAEGGVRGLFDQSRGQETLSVGGARGPVRMESVSAVWDPQASSFAFTENVRLWQEQNLMLAETVETVTGQDRILAKGGIKTIFVPEEEPEESPDEGEVEQDAPGESEDDEPSVSRDPVEVTSRWMEYATDTKTVIYHDQVRITQAGRVLSCNEAEARMLAGGGVDTVDCRGNARVDDSVAGRRVRGDTAFFEVGMGQVTFTGVPVVMTGEKGEHIEGHTLVYDLDTGGARIGAGSSSDSQPSRSEPPEASSGTDSETEG